MNSNSFGYWLLITIAVWLIVMLISWFAKPSLNVRKVVTPNSTVFFTPSTIPAWPSEITIYNPSYSSPDVYPNPAYDPSYSSPDVYPNAPYQQPQVYEGFEPITQAPGSISSISEFCFNRRLSQHGNRDLALAQCQLPGPTASQAVYDAFGPAAPAQDCGCG